MTFDEIKEEAYQAYKVSTDKTGFSDYTLYAESNENLCELFKLINVENKDVLTVLASSDQALSCYVNDAKTIDTFDKIRASIWYAYLRKWIILYQNKFYPSFHFFDNGDKELYDLICKIIPENQDEADAQIFWKIYLAATNYKSDYYLFNSTICRQPKPFFNNIEKIKHFYDKEINFKCLNICDSLSIDKKYDILILSNILEHTFNNDERIMVKNNIENLLKDDGIAVCTSLIYDFNSPIHKNEVKILTNDNLELVYEAQYYEELIGDKKDLAYIYQKKKRY